MEKIEDIIHFTDEAKITEFDLPDEPDRGFVTDSGFRFRAKLQIGGSHIARPVPNAVKGEIAPTTITYQLSLSELDEDNKVKTLDGKLLIHDPFEITISPDQAAKASWSLEEIVMREVRRLAKRSENIAKYRDTQMKEVERLWSIDTPAPAPSPSELLVVEVEALPEPEPYPEPEPVPEPAEPPPFSGDPYPTGPILPEEDTE